MEDLCITPFQHEMRAAPAGGAQLGVATGQSVLDWRLGYAEVFRILLHPKRSIHIDLLHPELFSQG